MGYRKLEGVTEGENGLQELTGYYYKGLQGVTRCYRGLQGVTSGYKNKRGLQRITNVHGVREVTGVTGGYKVLQKATRG